MSCDLQTSPEVLVSEPVSMAFCTDMAASGTPPPTRFSWPSGSAPTEEQWCVPSLHQSHLGALAQQMQKGELQLN